VDSAGPKIRHAKGQFTGEGAVVVKYIGTFFRELCKTAEPINMSFEM